MGSTHVAKAPHKVMPACVHRCDKAHVENYTLKEGHDFRGFGASLWPKVRQDSMAERVWPSRTG